MDKSDIVNKALDLIVEPVLVTPVCGDCGEVLIVTGFPDNTYRTLCPGCKISVFTDKHGSRVKVWPIEEF